MSYMALYKPQQMAICFLITLIAEADFKPSSSMFHIFMFLIYQLQEKCTSRNQYDEGVSSIEYVYFFLIYNINILTQSFGIKYTTGHYF